MSNILVIDDNEAVREGVAAAIRKMGHHVDVAASGAAGLALAQAGRFDFVITDLKMEQLDGVMVLREMAALDADVPVMIMTGFGTVEAAVEAMKHGAFDFITKPFSPDVVRLKTERALELVASRRERHRLVAHNDYLKAAVRAPTGIVGQSPGMAAVQAAIAKVAPTDATVFIHGESGTGKELVAQAMHFNSPRSQRAFRRVNCAAIPEILLERTLWPRARRLHRRGQAKARPL
jgi:two-component system response regulator HydG